MVPQIVFEDESILVINKPAGLVVNRADTTAKVMTLQDWIDNNYKFALPERCRSGIVHRLDKETSGVMVIAKKEAAFDNLQKQFKDRLVAKTYIALAHGRIEPSEGMIKAAISRSPFNRKKFGIFLGGREAVTEYKILRYYDIKKLGKFTLVELKPKTGRTHQIRVHLQYLGHPIVGDEFYTGGKTYRSDRKWCPRQFLHAQVLILLHPKTGLKREFKASLPADLLEAKQQLG